MSKELVRSGQRMYELAAKIEAEEAQRKAWPGPSRSSLPRELFPPASPRAAVLRAAPAVFLERGACAVYDREFFTRIERQPSGLYLRVECVRADSGADYAGQPDSRVLKLDQITGPLFPCPWCGDQGDVYQCDCGAWICGGRVSGNGRTFTCRDSCGRSWRIGDVATETRVNEETRRGGSGKLPHGMAFGGRLRPRPIRRGCCCLRRGADDFYCGGQ